MTFALAIATFTLAGIIAGAVLLLATMARGDLPEPETSELLDGDGE